MCVWERVTLLFLLGSIRIWKWSQHSSVFERLLLSGWSGSSRFGDRAGSWIFLLLFRVYPGTGLQIRAVFLLIQEEQTWNFPVLLGTVHVQILADSSALNMHGCCARAAGAAHPRWDGPQRRMRVTHAVLGIPSRPFTQLRRCSLSSQVFTASHTHTQHHTHGCPGCFAAFVESGWEVTVIDWFWDPGSISPPLGGSSSSSGSAAVLLSPAPWLCPVRAVPSAGIKLLDQLFRGNFLQTFGQLITFFHSDFSFVWCKIDTGACPVWLSASTFFLWRSNGDSAEPGKFVQAVKSLKSFNCCRMWESPQPCFHVPDH